MSDVAFWKSGFGKFLRWILFLPIAFTLSSILQLIPLCAVSFAAGYEMRLTLLTILGCIVLLSVITPLFYFWLMAVFMMPRLVCAVIAPNTRVASVMYGTLFCLGAIWSLVYWFGSGEYTWTFYLFQIFYAAIIMSGIVIAYQSAEEEAAIDVDAENCYSD